MPNTAYVHTDTADDAMSSFELASLFYEQALRDDRYWKWFVAAVHSGVQGIFALALQRSDGLLVQKPGVAKRTLAAFEAQAVPPPPHMDNFLRLHRKLQETGVLPTQGSDSVPDSAVQEEALSGIDRLRDDFLHFNTKAWSIAKASIERHARTSVQVARYLVLQSGSIRLYEPEDGQRMSQAIACLLERLNVDA
jgi:hypothetical protein